MPRPVPIFHGFVGRPQTVARLRAQIEGASARGEPFPPVLLIGPSGSGKSLLAESLAKECGTAIIRANGHEKPEELAAKLRRARAGDVVFLDEVHNASTKAQEMLFGVIDDGRLPRWACELEQPGEGGNGEDWIPLQNCTLILATDQPGHLLNALYRRMQIVEHLPLYGKREMEEIVDRIASNLNLFLTSRARNQIASISGGLPRKAKYHLLNVRRHFANAEQQTIDLPQIRTFLRVFEINQDGLGALEWKYLRFLAEVDHASVESLAMQLGVDADFVQRQLEPLLFRERLTQIGPGGRSLTAHGKTYIETNDDPKVKPIE